MIPKKKRVTKVLFEDVLKKGRRIDGDFMYIKYLKAEQSRFSAVVPKSVEKTAVGRNTIRRKLRAFGKEVYENTSIYSVVFAKKGIKTATSKEIKEDLQGLFKKI